MVDLTSEETVKVLALKLRLKYGWSVIDTDLRKLKQVLWVLIDLHNDEEEIAKLNNKKHG